MSSFHINQAVRNYGISGHGQPSGSTYVEGVSRENRGQEKAEKGRTSSKDKEENRGGRKKNKLGTESHGERRCQCQEKWHLIFWGVGWVGSRHGHRLAAGMKIGVEGGGH